MREDSQKQIDERGFRGKLAFCSNFFPASFIYEGKEYPTSEHAFQAAKTNDQERKEFIRLCETPGKAKRAGGDRKKTICRPDWNEVRIEIMEEILREKFSQNSDLAANLAATWNQPLIEYNTWNDTFWGVCRGKGENNLGKLLTKIRAEIQTAIIR